MHAQCVKLRFQLAELVPAHSVTLLRSGKAGVRRTLGTCEACKARMGESCACAVRYRAWLWMWMWLWLRLRSRAADMHKGHPKRLTSCTTACGIGVRGSRPLRRQGWDVCLVGFPVIRKLHIYASDWICYMYDCEYVHFIRKPRAGERRGSPDVLYTCHACPGQRVQAE